MARSAIEPPRTTRGAATRARIVDAAATLMRSRGVASTSLDAVLAASETSKSQLYHYFADKDALVLAVVQRQTEQVLALHAPLLRALRSLAGLRRWRDAVVQSARDEECAGGCPLGSLATELAETPRSRAALAEGFARWHAEFVTGLEAMRTSGRLDPDADTSALATTLLTALQGGLLLAQVTRSTRPLELGLDAAIAQVQARARAPDARGRRVTGAAARSASARPPARKRPRR